MADDHRHDHHHDEKPAASSGKSMSDDLFNKVIDYVQGKIATFVAFLFLLITIGAIYGAVVVSHPGTEAISPFLVIAPAIMGFIAYYNRDFAVFLFILLFLFFIFI